MGMKRESAGAGELWAFPIDGINGSLAESLLLDPRACSGGKIVTASVRCRARAAAVGLAARLALGSHRLCVRKDL